MFVWKLQKKTIIKSEIALPNTVFKTLEREICVAWNTGTTEYLDEP